MIQLNTVLLRSHLIPLHTLVIFKYLTHLNKLQQLLRKTVLQLQQNTLLPIPGNQLKIPYLIQFHNSQSMIQMRSLTHLHQLHYFKK